VSVHGNHVGWKAVLSSMNTDDHFSLIDESRMPPATDRAVKELLCVCFPEEAAFFSVTRYWHGSFPAYSVIHGSDEGWLDGNIAIVIREIQVGTQAVRIAGVQNMAVRPGTRGGGVGAGLMERALAEARRRGVPFGLLFCVPELAKYYGRYGWKHREVAVTMDYNGETGIPIPGKNICMTLKLGESEFPGGDVHLGGADW
jgi:predicted N-acetyltransferase YhbS